MSNSKRILFVMLSLHGMLTSCAYAPWKSVDPKASPETNLQQAQREFSEAPEVSENRKSLLVSKELAVNQWMQEANQAKQKGDYEQAKSLYARILQMLPEDSAAQIALNDIEHAIQRDQQIASARNLLDQKQTKKAADSVRKILLEQPDDKAALKLHKEILSQLPAQVSEPPVLKPPHQRPVSLELRDANIKVVFEALSRATGINFVLDKDIKPDTKANVFIKKMRMDEAIDMVLSSNGLQKKTLSENTVLVYPNTSAKLKDYQELIIRNFYLTNASAKQVSSMLKTMLKTKDIYVDERLNMIVMRDTPEAVRIAEKLVLANDMADPEVMLDIEVLEISRSRLQELGILYPSQIGVVSSSTLTIEALRKLKAANYSVSASPELNFKKTTGDVDLLSNPRIRVRNNEKAKILVGDKVPIITTTSTANVGISESVTYVDVGLKLNVEPRVTMDDFVNIKVGLEVSSLGEKTTTNNGATVYTIGTRNADTVLRLKNGETQVLAGLILDDERKSASKLPALGDIPLLGRLFTNREDKKSKTEIVLAITPRILGNIQRPVAEFAEYWSGTETLVTDKPQLSAPAPALPSTPQERIREQIRARQESISPQDTPSNQDALPPESNEPAPASAPNLPPVVESNQEQIAAPSISPNSNGDSGNMPAAPSVNGVNSNP